MSGFGLSGFSVSPKAELQQWVFGGEGVYGGDLQSGSETVRRGQ